MSLATLTSLAMLKVHVDQGHDYLDYLRPFILQVLVDHKSDSETDTAIRDSIRDEYGLEIPVRAVQVVLKRLARKYSIKREHGVYKVPDNLPDPRIGARKADADRHIAAVTAGLVKFSVGTSRPVSDSDEAVAAICAFLLQFNIPCLRAFLRGTAIPALDGGHHTDVVLVSQYFLHLQGNDPERFESFMVVVQGHMLANALLCPDLQNAPKTYRGVTFYFDTPLLARLIGVEGAAKQAAVRDLLRQLRQLGANVAVFAHTRDELERVINGAADHLNDPDGRSAIVTEARRIGTSRSDLLLIAGRVDDRILEAGLKVCDTPPHIENFQIDEDAFERALSGEVAYSNPRAREYDINSVRSIYVLRRGSAPTSIERSKAVFVSSNAGFARAADKYGRRHEESREVSSVITDFSLANMAWLKAPLGAPTLPMTEVMAFSYAALQPSGALLDKYLAEVDRLETEGKITARDHQLLRSSQLAQDAMMNLTLGEEDALTEETIAETLKRISDEIKKDESAAARAARAEQLQTQALLDAERAEKKDLQERLFWRCKRRAAQWSWAAGVALVVLLFAGVAGARGLKSSTPIVSLILTVGAGLCGLVSVLDLLVGFSVMDVRRRVEELLLTTFLRREADATGLEMLDGKWNK